MDYEESLRLRSTSRYLIQQVQEVRVESAFGQVPSELRRRLRNLLDVLEKSTSDRELWRALAHADPYRDEFAAHQLRTFGSVPWRELLHSGGYTSPPPPTADELGAALAMNVRHALDESQSLSPKEYRESVLYARGRLKLHVRVIRSRLDLTSYGYASAGLSHLGEVTTVVALDTAGALAIPSIVDGAGAVAETVASGGLSIVTSVLSRIGERTWHALNEHRELRRPQTERARQDPVLQLLALMMDTVQELRELPNLRLMDSHHRTALEDQLRRQASWMREMLGELHEHLAYWEQIDKLSPLLHDSWIDRAFDASTLEHLMMLLDAAFEARSTQ